MTLPTDPLWGSPTEAADWVCWTLATPRPGPFAEKTPWTIPQETPTCTPSQHPSRQAGARRPRPVYSPPVFRLTSTEILNVLYTPGPCVSPGEGGIQVGSFSALGAEGTSRTPGAQHGLGHGHQPAT